MNKPFYFIADPLKTYIKKDIYLLPKYRLKKPDDIQLKLIKNKWLSVKKTSFLMDVININPYEFSLNKSKDNTTLNVELKNNYWKYWVLEYDISTREVNPHLDIMRKDYFLIDLAFLLSDLNLQLLWGFISYDKISDDYIHINIFKEDPYRAINFYKDNRLTDYHNTKTIKRTDIEEIKSLIKLIEANFENGKHTIIKKALQDYREIYEISKNSPFRIIGLFAILEHLLTIDSFSRDNSSINKQLQSKINLLNGRFENQIMISDYFDIKNTVTFEKIIKELYSYRSDIAHGNKIDFEKKLQALNNHKSVQLFLDHLVKKCLIQSLKEPDLILDLKKC